MALSALVSPDFISWISEDALDGDEGEEVDAFELSLGRECTQVQWNRLVDGVRYIVGDRSGAPLDPLQRTASELKLCGSLYSVPTSLRLSPSEADLCEGGSSTWPPKLLGDPAKPQHVQSSLARTPSREACTGAQSIWHRSANACFERRRQPSSGQSLQPTTASLLAESGFTRANTARLCGKVHVSCESSLHQSAICDALRGALLAAVDGPANHQVVVCVWRGRDVAASSRTTAKLKDVVTQRMESCEKDCHDGPGPEYFFEFVVPEEAAFGQVRDALQVEAAAAGALRMMPAMVEELGDELGDVRHLVLRIELEASGPPSAWRPSPSPSL